MGKSKAKSKKNMVVPGEPMSQKEFDALIKEAEKGPFQDLDGLVEEIKLQWEKTNKSESKDLSRPLTKGELRGMIKKAEQGPFYTHNELITKLNSWKKSLKK